MRTTKFLASACLAFALSCSPAPDPSGGGGGNPGGGGPPPAGSPPPLIVESAAPANAQLNIALQQAVTITFNLAVSAPSVSAQSVFFTSPLGPVDGTLTVQDNVVTFTPSQDYPIASPISGTVTTDVVGANNEQMAGDYEWTFGTLSLPVVIASGDGIEQPCVAVSAGGLVMTMWVQNDGGTWRLFARSWEPATGWAATYEFEVSAGQLTGLRLACTENNEAVALWFEGDSFPYTLRTARFVAGSGWGDPQTLTDIGYITFSAFDMHREGWGGVVYYDQPSQWASIKVRYLSPDGTWGDAIERSIVPWNVTAGGDGALYTTYSATNSRTGVAINLVTRYAPGEGVGEQNVDDGEGLVVYGGASDPDGAMAYYISYGDVAVWRYDGLEWSQIGAIDLPDDGVTVAADLATNPAGEACLTWDFQQMATPYRRLMGVVMDSEGNWTEAERLDLLDGLVMDAAAACTDSGEGWVVFNQYDLSTGSIWFARHQPGSGWEPTVEIDGDEYNCFQPRLAAQGPGGCAVWFRTNGTTQLMARILN